MSVLAKLASSTGKRSKAVNKSFAQDIAESGDTEAIEALIGLLSHEDKNIRSDSIEVLYETGYVRPDLIAAYHQTFTHLLESKNNRLVWGAMIALSCVSKVAPEVVFNALPTIRKAVDRGSVITKDAGVAVYANLATIKKQRKDVLPLLLDALQKCPDKQLAQYIEKSIVAIDADSKNAFIELIDSRLTSLEKASQVGRVKKARGLIEKS